MISIVSPPDISAKFLRTATLGITKGYLAGKVTITRRDTGYNVIHIEKERKKAIRE